MHTTCKQCSEDIIEYGRCPRCPQEYQEHPVDIERDPILEKLAKKVDKNQTDKKLTDEFQEKVQPLIDELRQRLDNKVKELQLLKKKAVTTLKDSLGKTPYPADFQNSKKTVELQRDELTTLLNYYQNSLKVLEEQCLNRNDEFYLVRVLKSRLNNLDSFLNGFGILSSEEILSFPADSAKSFLFSDPASLGGNAQYLVLFDVNGRRSVRGNKITHGGSDIEPIQPGIYRFFDNLVGYDNFRCNTGLTINGVEKTQLILRLPQPYFRTNYAFAPNFNSIFYDGVVKKLFWMDRFYMSFEEIILPNPEYRTIFFATNKYIYSWNWTKDILEVHESKSPYSLISRVKINVYHDGFVLIGRNKIIISSSSKNTDGFFGRYIYSKTKKYYFELEIIEDGDEIHFDAKRVNPPDATFDFFGIKLDNEISRKYAPGVYQWPDGRFFDRGSEFVLHGESIQKPGA